MKWIKCSERMPEGLTRVLVKGAKKQSDFDGLMYGEVHIGFYFYKPYKENGELDGSYGWAIEVPEKGIFKNYMEVEYWFPFPTEE